MPASVAIIDTVPAPTLALLQQVLDTGGPYSAGDHTLSTFHTTGGFGLPAGTYNVGDAFGMIIQASTFPIQAGRQIGWNDVTFPTISGDTYFDRIAQVCKLHQLPLTGAYVITDTVDVHLASQLFLWPPYIASPAKIGLHVFPNFAVDLFYLCVL